AYPADPRVTGQSAQQIAHFCETIEDGDLVLASDGATALGVGRINGPYTYASAEAFPHERSVEWLHLGDWQLPTPEGLQTTVFEYRRRPDNFMAIERQVLDARPTPPPAKFVRPSEEGARKHAVWTGGGRIGRIQDLLNRKGQAILYGPPGTG